MAVYNKKFIMLFSNCIPVKGVVRSIIVDTQRNNFKFISNDLFDIILKFPSTEIQDIYRDYDEENKAVIDEYFDFILSNEFAFLTDTPSRFPLISTAWETPRSITNAIIDINKDTCYNIDKAIEKIDEAGTEALQIRIYDEIPFLKFKKICDFTFLKTKRLRSVQFVLKYNDYTLSEYFLKLVEDNLLTSEVIIHSCSFSKVLATKLGFNIIYTTEKVNDSSKCGCINPNYFTPNLSHVNEAKNYNTCLNRKISIDVNGAIKNCPSMNTEFGKIDDFKDFIPIITQEKFKEVWTVKKDEIEICKICEFRLICTDCRAYVKNKFDKPFKCSYNPYNAKWEN